MIQFNKCNDRSIFKDRKSLEIRRAELFFGPHHFSHVRWHLIYDYEWNPNLLHNGPLAL